MSPDIGNYAGIFTDLSGAVADGGGERESRRLKLAEGQPKRGDG